MKDYSSGEEQRHQPCTYKITAEALLAKVRLPQHTLAHLEALNAPIYLEDIYSTIKSLASDKAPGPDGYTAKF